MTTNEPSSPEPDPAPSSGSTPTLSWTRLALLVLLGLVAWFGIGGVRQIDTGRRGVHLSFGRYVATLPPGIHLTLPAPFAEVVVVDTSTLLQMSIGYRLIDQFQGRGPTIEEVEWLTGDTNLVEFQADLGFRVADPRRWVLGTVVRGQAPTFLLRKIGESVYTELIGSLSIDDAILGSGILGEAGRLAIQQELDRMQVGVELVNVNVTSIAPPRGSVGTAFEEVGRAESDSRTRYQEALGYASELVPRTRREADQIRADATIYESQVVGEARGAADRFSQIAKEARAAPELTARRLWLEFLEQALAGPRVHVYDPEGPGLGLHRFDSSDR